MRRVIEVLKPLGTARVATALPVAVGVVVAWLGALMSSSGAGEGAVTTALALVSLAWAVELYGVPWPRWAFIAAVTVPAAFLHGTPQAIHIPLLIVPMVGWLGYTSTTRWGLVALAVSLANLLPYMFGQNVLFLPWTAATVFIWLASRGLARQERLLAELRAAQDDLAGEAAAAERRRIAGEIHDVVAHSLAVMVLHLTGARMLLQRDGADARAVAAIAEAESQGRQSLEDVRRTVGLLREEAPGGTALPLPRATDLPALVGQYRAAGLAVSLDAEGALGELPASTGLALYRIVQEALANVVKHAPGSNASVELTVGAAARLRVRNSLPTAWIGPTETCGHGVAGMRERAELLGGQVTAGREDGAWVVEATLPLARPEGESVEPEPEAAPREVVVGDGVAG
jgi:signal transduction histidine kinase